MPMLLRGRAGPQAAQHRDKDRIERRNPRTDQDLPPPQFWDNLSHIPLVKRALRELDRRNSTTQLRGQDPEVSRPSPGDPRQLGAGINQQDIRRFSRTGGPDLSDLRGVCCSICSFAHLVPSQYISCAQLVLIVCLCLCSHHIDISTVCVQSHTITTAERTSRPTSRLFKHAQARLEPWRPRIWVRPWKASAQRRRRIRRLGILSKDEWTQRPPAQSHGPG